MSYQQLTEGKRYQISTLLELGIRECRTSKLNAGNNQRRLPVRTERFVIKKQYYEVFNENHFLRA